MDEDKISSLYLDIKKINRHHIQEMIRVMKNSYLFKYKIGRYKLYNSTVYENLNIKSKSEYEQIFESKDEIIFNENLDTSLLIKKMNSVLVHPNHINESDLLNQDSVIQDLIREKNVKSHIPKISQSEIEYKSVDPKYFNNSGRYTATEIKFTFSEDYISKDFIKVLNFGKHDTTVVNIGTGTGKSYTAHHLINFYATNGYIVIIASPFKVLVNRDYNNLLKAIDKEIKIINYKDLSNLNFKEFSRANIHSITINSLLGNPGDPDDPDQKQAAKKERYLDELLMYCKENKKEVILFFDEIHAGINNFKPSLKKKLDCWNGIVKKVFVLSATFTEASNVVLGYLAELTQKNLTIYNCKRRKSPVQANLHIHITERRYTSKDISPLSFIKNIIEGALERNERVNILVATQSLAIALSDQQSKQPLAQYLSSLDLNLLIGKNGNTAKNGFEPDKINIGTAFNTGVSIDEPKNTFIIITPVFIGPESQKLASIFMDGTPAIIQAIARVRNGGNIHVFMNKPTHLINGEYKIHLPDFLNGLGNSRYIDCNKQSEIVEECYLAHHSQIKRLEKYGRNLMHRNRNDFTLFKSQYELASKHEIFGKKVNPYIIWAAYNDQFSNCTLKTINLVEEPSTRVEINEETLTTDLKQQLSQNQDQIRNAIKDREALDKLLEDIYLPKSNPLNPVKIYLKGKEIKKEHALFYPTIARALINILYQIRNGEEKEFDTSDYILGNIILAQISEYSHSKDKRNNLIAAYLILEKVRNKIKEFVLFEAPLSPEVIDFEMEVDICTALSELREHDFFIHNKTYSFLQTYLFTFQGESTIKFQIMNGEQRRKILYRGLTDLFFDWKSEVRKVNGKSCRNRIILNEKEPSKNRIDLNSIIDQRYLKKI